MTVYLYVLNTMADWEIGFLTAELNSKRYFRDRDADLSLVRLGSTGLPIRTMGGMALRPDCDVGSVSLQDEDFLILPGADSWFDEENRAILDIAKSRIDNGLGVAAICGATFGLARVGALDRVRHTSNDKQYLKALCPEYRGEALYQEALAVAADGLITASGIAPLEFSYEVLKFLNVFRPATLENWVQLYAKKEPAYFWGLMNSLK